MNFSDLTCCPFCGSEEYYAKFQVSGSTVCNIRFDGLEAEDNSAMYDGLSHSGGNMAYCNRCGEYLGNIVRNSVGKKALTAKISKRTEIQEKR